MILKGCYQTEYIVEDDRPVILEFIRHEDGSKEIKKIPGHKPYFFVDESAVKVEHDSIVSFSEPDYKNLYGNKVRRIEVTNPYNVPEVRDIYNGHNWEADVSYHLRYLIDNVEAIEKTKYRINHIDIETTTMQGFPDINNPVESIICLTIYDNFDDKYHFFLWSDNIVENKEQAHPDQNKKIIQE
jgi:DNA polymerase elongation subunit (family B)